jgi:hypothetical protein
LFVSLTTLLMAAVGGGWSFFSHPAADAAALLWVLWLMAVAEGRGMGSGSEFDRGQAEDPFHLLTTMNNPLQ